MAPARPSTPAAGSWTSLPWVDLPALLITRRHRHSLALCVAETSRPHLGIRHLLVSCGGPWAMQHHKAKELVAWLTTHAGRSDRGADVTDGAAVYDSRRGRFQ